MVADHIASGAGGDRGRHPPAAVDGRPVRRDRGRPPTAGGSGRSGRSRPTRWACPTRPTRSTRRWATTSSPPTLLCEVDHRGRAEPRRASTTWAAASSRCWSSAARPTSTTSATTRCPAAPTATAATGATSGTLDSFYDAHMDLIDIHPVFNLYNYEWPIYTDYRPWPPAKFVHGWEGRVGRAVGSMVSPGVVISGVAGGELGGVAERAGALVGHGRGLGAHGGRRHRPQRRGPQRDPRQERDRARGRRRSASTSTATASGSPCRPTASSWSARARRSTPSSQPWRRGATRSWRLRNVTVPRTLRWRFSDGVGEVHLLAVEPEHVARVGLLRVAPYRLVVEEPQGAPAAQRVRPDEQVGQVGGELAELGWAQPARHVEPQHPVVDRGAAFAVRQAAQLLEHLRPRALADRPVRPQPPDPPVEVPRVGWLTDELDPRVFADFQPANHKHCARPSTKCGPSIAGRTPAGMPTDRPLWIRSAGVRTAGLSGHGRRAARQRSGAHPLVGARRHAGPSCTR